jgi:hypothetical protein
MSRIDRHVAAVQNKLTLGQFLLGLGWGLLVLAGVVWLNVLVDRLISWQAPYAKQLIWVGVGCAVAFAIGFAYWHRPDKRAAALAIDEKLGLKEKFSTALYARGLQDPFANAAVRDAEASAAGVDLHGQFKLGFPRVGYWAVGAFVLVLATMQIPRQNLFASSAQVVRKNDATPQARKEARDIVKRAIANVEQAPRAVQSDEKIELAKKELEKALSKADKDPLAAKRTAMKAQQELEDAIKQKIKDNQKFAEAQNNDKMLKGMTAPPPEEKGPVADAHRDIAKGEFSKAVDDLTKAVENFDKMDKKDQEKTADQMNKLANQLKQMAQDPKVQQQMQKQLQQMGANPQQAQQLAQKIQQAAAGDKQAQQQLQQMQQQLMQQMNNGQGPTAQQQQQINQMMQQMQAQANTQQGAQAMAQAAQKMAQAMQQQAQDQPQPQQNPNAQNQQQQGGQGQQQQPMAQGQQQMQQQLQQMQAMQQDMQQMAAARQAAQQGAQQAQDAMNAGNNGGAGQGQNGNQDGQGQGQGAGGQQQQNGPPGQGGGMMAGGGQATGDRSAKQAAPFTVKQELAPSQENEKGKILASRLVKAGSLKGESKAELVDAATAAEQAQTDEVEQERITGQAREAQRKYFNSLQQDAGQ